MPPDTNVAKAKELQETATQKAGELKEKATVVAATAAGAASSFLKTASEKTSEAMPIQIVSDNGKIIVCRVNANGRPENVNFAPYHLVKLYGSTWYKVSSNGTTGWIYSNYAHKQ